MKLNYPIVSGLRINNGIVVRQLSGSDLQWFEAARSAQKTASKQRALNFNVEIVRELFGNDLIEQGGVLLESRCVHPKAKHSSERLLSLQGKNWRLGGKKVEGEAFDLVEPDDFFVARFESDRTAILMTWTIIMRRESMTSHFQAGSMLPDLKRRMIILSPDDKVYARIDKFLVPELTESRSEPLAFHQPVRAALENEIYESTQYDHSPDFARLILGISRVGYRFHDAVCDLIDNCIDAVPQAIFVRFVKRLDQTLKIHIVDDGKGMEDGKINSALRFGSPVQHHDGRLGKFGLGLKFASLSQTRKFTVASKVESGKWVAFQSDVSRLEQGNFKPTQVAFEPEHSFPVAGLGKSGTIVTWESVKFEVTDKRVEAALEDQRNALWMHLRLIYHRFLKRKQFKLFMDVQIEGEELNEASLREVTALDPFASPSDNKLFPATADLTFKGHVFSLSACLWNTNYLTESEYTLIDGGSASQGFYFYRNDRLITYGNWAESFKPATKFQLLRISIDIPPSADDMMNLNVAKSDVSVPPYEFTDLLSKLNFSNGKDLSQMLQLADKAWGQRSVQAASAETNYMLGDGFESLVSDQGNRYLKSLRKKMRPLHFEWGRLEEDQFFSIDKDRETIVLNDLYRRASNNGTASGSADAQIPKTLIYLLLRHCVNVQRRTENHRRFLEECNQLLVIAAKSALRRIG